MPSHAEIDPHLAYFKFRFLKGSLPRLRGSDLGARSGFCRPVNPLRVAQVVMTQPEGLPIRFSPTPVSVNPPLLNVLKVKNVKTRAHVKVLQVVVLIEENPLSRG